MEFAPVKNFTIKRTINALKVFCSYQLSLLTRKPVIWGLPVYLFLEPTNRCNFQCPECASGIGALTRPLGMMKTDLFKSFIDQVADRSLYLQLYLQGEPYLNKNIGDMIAYAQEKRMYVVVSTNGSFLSEKNIEKFIRQAPDKLVFSMDGLDEETYQNYRVGGTFAQADSALRLIVETKKRMKAKRPFIELQFIVMKQNEHQADEVIRYGRSIGVDQVTLKTMQVSSLESAKHFLPKNEKYRRYIVGEGSFRMKGKLRNRCLALWQTAVVTWDGKLVPCCFDKDAEFVLADYTAAGPGFAEIWQSPAYNAFRQRVLGNRKAVPMCTNCTSGLSMNIFEAEF